jgi:CxxC-x17-CxxC domain-containing protein
MEQEQKPRRDLDKLQKKYTTKCIVCEVEIEIPFKPKEENYCPACWGKKLKT